MELSENEAWERLRLAILRCREEDTAASHAEVERARRAFVEACGEGGAEPEVARA
ncbi:MAG TPA: hypothetical protein VFA12_20360 [Stellaceae bacterium]|nr:hypothetical protein [Stellaceae bacterium]